MADVRLIDKCGCKSRGFCFIVIHFTSTTNLGLGAHLWISSPSEWRNLNELLVFENRSEISVFPVFENRSEISVFCVF